MLYTVEKTSMNPKYKVLNTYLCTEQAAVHDKRNIFEKILTKLFFGAF